jgi:hypothetical protein
MTETELRVRGVRILMDALGPVEAERFIALVLREPFDYTEWQKDLWADKTIAEIAAMWDRVQEQPGEK